MNMMIVLKRSLVVLLALSGLALCAFAANQDTPCPLPVSDRFFVSADFEAIQTQSPERPHAMRAVTTTA